MSEAMLLRRGGALSPCSAVIHVAAAVGSTVSFSKGGVVVRELGPGKAHPNAADNTLADWYCPVAPANYGAWTVTASLAGSTASAAVTVDSNKQYDVALHLPIYLYDQGDQRTPVTGGWEVSTAVAADEHYPSTTAPVFNSDRVSFSLTGSATNKCTAVNTVGAVNLTRYSTLHVAYTQSIGDGAVYWSVCADKTQKYVEDAAANVDNYKNNMSITTLDETGCTGWYYVYFAALSWTSTGTAELTGMWLS